MRALAMGRIVECERVSKNYGEGELVVRAIRDVDLVVEQGEFLSLLAVSVVWGLAGRLRGSKARGRPHLRG